MLSIVHGMLLGTFVPATLMIIFRNLPIRWWLPAIAIYSIRVGFALDTITSLVGFYVDHLGWQWLYWQSVVIAPLMGLMVYLGTPREPVNRDAAARCRLGRHAAARHVRLDDLCRSRPGQSSGLAGIRHGDGAAARRRRAVRRAS